MLSYLSHVRLFATLWNIARQAPMSMGFSRQEYCSGLPCHPLGDLPDPGIEPTSLISPALAPPGSTHWLNSSFFIYRENNSFEIFQESSGKFHSLWSKYFNYNLILESLPKINLKVLKYLPK